MEDADLVKAVRELQKSVAALEQRNNDLVLKAQIFSIRAAGNWGWDRFLSEPEFWENIYDTGLADCQGRCIRDLNAGYKACDDTHEKFSTEWKNCRAEALSRAIFCQDNCADANPVVP
jgi:hypothetical protein